MALLQPNWEWIAERYGVPTVVLVVICFVVGYVAKAWIWPDIKARLDRAEKAADQVQQILSSQLEKAQTRIEKADEAHENLVGTHGVFVRRVTEALEEQTRINREVAEGMRIVLERTKRL